MILEAIKLDWEYYILKFRIWDKYILSFSIETKIQGMNDLGQDILLFSNNKSQRNIRAME